MQEYFIAKWICRWLLESSDVVEEFFKKVELTGQTIKFSGKCLYNLPSSDAVVAQSKLENMIGKTRHCSSNYASISRLGATSVSIYFCAWSTLPKIDWSYLALNGAYLPEAVFTGLDLSCTSLRNATLDNVIFTNATLTNCDLTGVKFEETKDICSMTTTTDRKYLCVLYSDGKLRKWDIYNPQSTHLELTTFNVDFISKAKIHINGIMILQQDNHVFFTQNQDNNDIKIHGGISCHDVINILDIKSNSTLIHINNELILVDFPNNKIALRVFNHEHHHCNGVIISESLSFITIAYEDETILLQLFTSDDNNPIRKNSIELSELGILEKITALSTIFDNDKIFVAIGTKGGILYLFECLHNEGLNLKKISSFEEQKKYIKNIAILDDKRIAYTGSDGIIYVLKLNDYDELHEIVQWKLAVQCDGAVLDGIIPLEQEEKLKSYQKGNTTEPIIADDKITMPII